MVCNGGQAARVGSGFLAAAMSLAAGPLSGDRRVSVRACGEQCPPYPDNLEENPI